MTRTTDDISRAEPGNLSGAPESTPCFEEICVALSLVFSVVLCRSLCVLFHLAIALPVLRFTASDYLLSFFKSFLDDVLHSNGYLCNRLQPYNTSMIVQIKNTFKAS